MYIAAARHKALASCNKWPLSRTEAYTDLFAQMTDTKEKIIYEAERTEDDGKGERGSVRKTGGDIKSQFGGVKPRVGEETVVVGRRREEGGGRLSGDVHRQDRTSLATSGHRKCTIESLTRATAFGTGMAHCLSS